MHMRKKIWTNELDNKLKELYASGISRESIADTLQMTKSSVVHRIDRLGLKRKNTHYRELSSEKLSEIADQLEYKSISEIAKAEGIANETLKRLLINNGYEVKSGRWTKEEIEKLREYSKVYTADEIALKLNKTRQSVICKTNKLDIDILKGRRSWTHEEDETLRELWGMFSLKSIANRLNRTENACLLRVKSLKLGSVLENCDYVTLKDFCENTGMTIGVITNRLVKNGFPLEYKKLALSKRHRLIDLTKAIIWMENNQNEFNGALVTDRYFVPEPEWLTKKRKEDIKKNGGESSIYKRRIWTKSEDQLIKDLVSMGIKHKEIANRLHRSIQSVNSRIERLGLSYKANKFWTGKEFKFIQDNWTIMSDKELAEKLNRPVKSVELHRIEMGFI